MDLVMATARPLRRFDIYLVNLEPKIGSEMRKVRPCLIVSPDDMHGFVRTVIIAPMTSSLHNYPMRVPIRFQRKVGEVALDQVRAVDRTRLLRRLGAADYATSTMVAERLVEMFTL
jgi:mRNA interferase MazF